MKNKAFWGVLSALIVLMAIYTSSSSWNRTEQASAIESSKDIGVCTGNETAGRCADKCADPNWHIDSYEQETGAAICSPPLETKTPELSKPVKLPEGVFGK